MCMVGLRLRLSMIVDWVQARKARAAANLRYFNPVGAHSSGDLSEDPQGIPNNLVPYVLMCCGLRSTLSVFGDDYSTRDGTGVRDYIHVVDLAAGHLAAMLYLKQNSGVETFNLGTGAGTSVLEVVSAFATACDRGIPYEVNLVEKVTLVSFLLTLLRQNVCLAGAPN